MTSAFGIFLLATIVGLGVLWAFQRHLLYIPFGQVASPAEAGLPQAEEVSFRTEDGLTLAAWFVPAKSRPPAFTILVFNGNAGNRSLRASLAQALAKADLAALLFDYRGYGGNPGRPSEAGLAADARGARTYLEQRQDVDPRRIVYFGESLGTGVAIALALERPPAALILRSPYTSMTDLGQYHYPFLPVGLLLSDRYPSIERIGQIRCPLLIIAGDRDAIVPPQQSLRLFNAALEPKRLVMIPGADHNDYALLAGELLIEEMVRFVAAAGSDGKMATDFLKGKPKKRP